MNNINELVTDKYQILKMIGQGNMGRVFLVKDLSLNRLYALKVVFSNEDNYEERKELILNEAKIMSSFNSVNIPFVKDVIINDSFTGFVMEYIKGISLQDYLQQNNPLDNQTKYKLIKEITDIMCYLHSRKPAIVYRDLKPSNLIISNEGVLKIIDFGIAASGFGSINTGTSYGTYGYSPKEQLSGKNVSTKTDVYAMGALFYYILTGIDPALPPFKPVKLGLFPDYFNNSLVKIIDKCTMEDCNDRFSNAAEVKKAFESACLSKSKAFDKIFLFMYYLVLFIISIMVLYGLYISSATLCISLLPVIIISKFVSIFLENRYYKHNFVIKRCYNIFYTKKNYLGLY